MISTVPTPVLALLWLLGCECAGVFVSMGTPISQNVLNIVQIFKNVYYRWLFVHVRV